MRRRAVIAGALAAAASRATFGQPSGRLKRVGWLNVSSAEINEPIFAAFREALAAHGYQADRNVAFDAVHADGALARVPALARDLVARRPDVVAVQTIAGVLALAAATTTIPIVMVAGNDPVAAGLTESLARPNRNITGFSSLREATIAKAIDLLRQVTPALRRLAVLHGADDPGAAFVRAAAEAAAEPLGIMVTAIAVRDGAEATAALRAGLAEASPPDAIIVNSDPVIWPATEAIAAFAAERHLPATYTQRQMAVDGGLMAVAFDPFELARGAAVYVARILDGTPVAALPFQQASRIVFTLNLAAARRAAIAVPATLIAVADEVIE